MNLRWYQTESVTIPWRGSLSRRLLRPAGQQGPVGFLRDVFMSLDAVDIIEQLRQAIRDNELSVYALAKLTGVSSQQIGRFTKGERGLTLESFSAIAKKLGLQLVIVEKVAEEKIYSLNQLLCAAEKEITDLERKLKSCRSAGIN